LIVCIVDCHWLGPFHRLYVAQIETCMMYVIQG
jgi:hypothetical protein